MKPLLPLLNTLQTSQGRFLPMAFWRAKLIVAFHGNPIRDFFNVHDSACTTVFPKATWQLMFSQVWKNTSCKQWLHNVLFVGCVLSLTSERNLPLQTCCPLMTKLCVNLFELALQMDHVPHAIQHEEMLTVCRLALIGSILWGTGSFNDVQN